MSRKLDKLYRELSSNPKNVDTKATSTLFYSAELLKILKGRFIIKCPSDWDKDYILDTLLLKGVFCVTDTRLGVLPLECSVYGVNVFNRPSKIVITNPILKTIRRTLREDAEIVYLYDDKNFRTVNLLIDMYAQKLANCDGSIDVNLMNTRTPLIFECADSQQVATAKAMYDKISRGEPAIFKRAKNALETNELIVHMQNTKNSYIVDNIQDAKRTILNEFLTIIGINNANTDKRERLNSDEVNANNQELFVNIDYWKENLKLCSERVRKMFNVEFDISLKEYEVNYDNKGRNNDMGFESE